MKKMKKIAKNTLKRCLKAIFFEKAIENYLKK